MSCEPLIIPLVCPDLSFLDEKHPGTSIRDVMELDCSRAEITSLAPWGFNSLQQSAQSKGVVLGCEDGSLYVFTNSLPSLRLDTSRVDNALGITSSDSSITGRTRPLNGGRHTGPAGSRSTSPSSLLSLQSPFVVTPRARVVSGISKEQVEAPKNFVDYEDEPDKLREMLKGKNGKDKSTNSFVSSSERTIATEKKRSLSRPSSPASSQGNHPGHKRKEDVKSPLSPTSSLSALTPRMSIISLDDDKLSLFCHILPCNPCPDNPVKDVIVSKSGDIIFVLQELGNISIYRTTDGSCIANMMLSRNSTQELATVPAERVSQDVWAWKRLQAYESDESVILLASASVDATVQSAGLDTENVEDNDRARLALLEFRPGDDDGPSECILEKLCEWNNNSSAKCVGLHRELNGDMTLLRASGNGDVILQSLQIYTRIRTRSSETATPVTSIGSKLPLSNPFKMIKSRSAEVLPLDDKNPDLTSVHFGEERYSERIFQSNGILELRVRSTFNKALCLVWTERELSCVEYLEGDVECLFILTLGSSVREVTWADETTFGIRYKGRMECYEVVVSPDDERSERENLRYPVSARVKPRLAQTFNLSSCQACQLINSAECLLTSVDHSGRRRLQSAAGSGMDNGNQHPTRTLWKATRGKASSNTEIRSTAILPIDMNNIVLGYSNGIICRISLYDMARVSPLSSFEKRSQQALGGYITALFLVENLRTRQRFIVGGSDDGAIALWSLESVIMTLELTARWTMFCAPLSTVVQINEELGGPLRGCLLCVSRDGTIAVVAVDGFQFLFFIPGSPAPLQRICFGSENLLLIYLDGCARLWDIQASEFRRSLSAEKADDILKEGGWVERSLDTETRITAPLLTKIRGQNKGVISASILLLNIFKLLSDTYMSLKVGISASKENALSRSRRLRLVSSFLLSSGLNKNLDAICLDTLNIPSSTTAIGTSNFGSVTLFPYDDGQSAWVISPLVSAQRALSIVATLRTLSLVEGSVDDFDPVLTFYSVSLPEVVGPSFQHPSLVYLAKSWFMSLNEVRQAAKDLFDVGVTRLSDDETLDLVNWWKSHLPCMLPGNQQQSDRAALALFLCGHIAADKHSLLPTGALIEIAKSVALYLHDEQSLHRVLAIDLCSRGFQVWQHYVDATEVLRALFMLATNNRKEAISIQNVGSQARLSVLQIASSNTPLFITTLALDIWSPRNIEHRKAVMQIVAFLIRKKPLVVYPNLPQLIEAVVKSLDPSSTASRDAVLDAAIEILGDVVKTFPTVDFHMDSQRLAVGTNEGAIIMYDLKTATRLYVLESHQKRLTACSFSPDGRRLVTISLEEGAVLVWKVGSSFTSFFTPGVPPRQGHGGSEPFKKLNFNVGEEAKMTVADTLEFVRFEWSANRSVKLKIRESILTFST